LFIAGHHRGYVERFSLDFDAVTDVACRVNIRQIFDPGRPMSFFTTGRRARVVVAKSARSGCPVLLLAWALAGLWSASPTAQQSRIVSEAVYTDAQAMRGPRVYSQGCASCHGDKLQGIEGPELIGNGFLSDFNKQPLAALVDKIRATMPLDSPGTLSPQQVSDVTAYLLKANQYPGGRAELPTDTAALNRITWSSAPAAVAQTSAGAVSQVPAWAMTGNLQQVMRGAFFQNSNIIFNVQTHDPGKKPEPGGKGDAGIDWVGWGSGIYNGWEAVDYAAIALAEATPMLLTPGRRCQNGKPVPVDRPDWIKFSMDFLEAARKSYRASQTRNQEAVSDSTNDLSDACLACHQVYRDKQSPGALPGAPASMALRCTP
jgi:mono/diheme cytochrome c family protein